MPLKDSLMGFRRWLMTARFSITSRNPTGPNTPWEYAGTTRFLASSGQIKIQLFPHEISLSRITCDEKNTCDRCDRLYWPSLPAPVSGEGLRSACGGSTQAGGAHIIWNFLA